MPSFNLDLTQKALRFVAHAHQGSQVPGSDLPYILHPVMVCMEVMAELEVESALDKDLAIQCALLHDVLEDTTVSYQELADVFGVPIADGVLALSKDFSLDKSDQLKDSLMRIRQQPKEIWMVKLADRIVNLSPPPADWSREKCSRYQQDAILIHETLKEASPSLSNRLLQKIEDYKQFC